MAGRNNSLKTGWSAWLTKLSLFALLFLAVTGLVVTFAPFSATVQWDVVAHTVVGVLACLPLLWYLFVHWDDYRRYSFSDVVLLGYVAVVALVVCLLSGLVVTWQGLFDVRMSPLWRQVHLYSTYVALLGSLPHVVLVLVRVAKAAADVGAGKAVLKTVAATIVALAVVAALPFAYSEAPYQNELPEDYSYLYGPDRPFAPSLATTTTGGAFDARSLAGSETCGSSGCHTQIYEEWRPSAHGYAAMDVLFQGIQTVMAQQNGAESTRYCGGCHDPISLFSGTKNIFAEDLTGLQGYNEGVSCLVCHGIRETDLQGNANYVMAQPSVYLWQWAEEGSPKLVRDFLIRTYPDEHMKLSKRLFKAPEYCAACHKQFIDEEVNEVGWVQLQNQYDNWKASHWFTEGDPGKTVECRECHMPLVDSADPASGDLADYNRSAADGKHRSHRFIASNSMMPKMLELPGWEEQVALTEKWLQGDYEIPEIADKWATGNVVEVALEVPEAVAPGETFSVQVILTANKVGHDFPTGPLDIIQSWVQLDVTDEAGNVVFSSGHRDDKNFIEPGSFLFKAEPVDQYGNLIDRHNLWEMVGVRFRRALFPGYSDTVSYEIACPSSAPSQELGTTGEARRRSEDTREVQVPSETGRYTITAKLFYRKVDQFLLNFLLGEDSGVSAPAIEMTEATATVEVSTQQAALGAGPEMPLGAGPTMPKAGG